MLFYDSSSTSTTAGTASLTVASGNAGILVATVFVDQSGNDLGTITDAQWNGVAMTELTHITHSGGQNDMLYTFYILNPASGTHNFTYTINGSYITAYTTVSSWKNAVQAAPQTYTGNTGNRSTSNTVNTSENDETILDFCGGTGGNGSAVTISANSGQSVYSETAIGYRQLRAALYYAGSNNSYTLNWSNPDKPYMSQITLAIKSFHVPKQFIQNSLTSDANLKAFYKLEDVNDSSGNSKNLTNTNTATFVSGKFNNGVLCARGSSQYLSIADNLSYTGGAYSICGWYKPTSQPTSGAIHTFAAVAEATTDTVLAIGYYDDSGTPSIWAKRTKYGTADQGPTTAKTLPNGSWTHWAITYDGTNVRSYINGQLLGSPTAASGSGGSAATDYAYIGTGAAQNTAHLMDGECDDVLFFNRTLSASEIKGIALDAPLQFYGSGGAANQAQNYSASITCGGTNRILLVGYRQNAYFGSNTVDSITYNGVPLTKIGESHGNSINIVIGLWYLINPAVGSNTLAFTSTGTFNMDIVYEFLEGAKQSAQPDTSTTLATAGGGSISPSVTTTADKCWGVAVAYTAGSGLAPSTNATERTEVSDRTAIYDTNFETHPAGTLSMTITGSGGDVEGWLASIAPYDYTGTSASGFTPHVIFM